MAKCSKCGRKGLFVKVDSQGICNDCQALAQRERLLAEIEKKLSDKQAFMKACQDEALSAIQHQINAKNATLAEINRQTINAKVAQNEAYEKLAKTTKDWDNASKRLAKIKPLYKSFMNIFSSDDVYKMIALNPELARKTYGKKIVEFEDEDFFSPSVRLHMHSMDLKDLRKKLKDNQAAIDAVVAKYQSRYTTKANRTIYSLMVIALEAELQNIIYNLNYGKLDASLHNVDIIIQKYLQIASDGNQTIVNTLVQFISEIEVLYKNAVQIEYEYYVNKERIKDEQRTIREQMRQEAEERRLLEEQRKKIEQEEEKYNNEIAKLQEQLANDSGEKKEHIVARIEELNVLLSQVETKKEEIITLQNGKAGYVYIISNLGSFGDNIFKVGMTRRQNPQDRVNELGSASVPFPFDVHGMIFSDDAVSLENQLHKMLFSRRVNKINSRKEFFRLDMNELYNLVMSVEPSAEFNTTMLAQQYRQTMTIDEGLMAELADDFENEQNGLYKDVDDDGMD